MKVVYIKEKNIYILVNGFDEIDFGGLSITPGEFWSIDKEKLQEHMTIIDVHASDAGHLVYNDKEERWEWHVFNEPRKRVRIDMVTQNTIYNKVEVVERIPLINLMKEDIERESL